jgi:enamine deaminase RidA (YjgF/YER057c/UK114 family)
MEKCIYNRVMAANARLLASCHHKGSDDCVGAGHTGAVTEDGSSLAGDFDAQFTQTFRNIEKTLTQCGCKLADIVTMTVFLIDVRYTTRMTELRAQLFGDHFPASAAITVSGFARPDIMLEVQCIAVRP